MAAVIFDRTLLKHRRNRAVQSLLSADFLFAEMAERLADRLADTTRKFPIALDVGAHVGFMARALAGRGGIETLVQMEMSKQQTRFAAFGEITSTPQSGAAKPEVVGASTPPHRYIVADEEWLPFAENRFDLILSCGSLHWVNDLPGALVQMQRALKPDGLFLAILPGGETLHELGSAFTKAESETRGGASPRVSPFLDVREAGALLQRAGFALPVVDVERVTLRYDNVFALMRDIRACGEASVLAARARQFLRRDTLLALARIYHEEWKGEDGRIPATVDFVTLTGWKPHASQPKPLAPGSGKVNLKSVL